MKKLFLLLVICSVLISTSVVFAIDYSEADTFEDDLIFSNDENMDNYLEDNSNSISTYNYDDYVDESFEDSSQYEKYWNENYSSNINNNKNHSNNHINQQKLYKYNDTLIIDLNDNESILNNSILKNMSDSINLSKDNNIEIQNMSKINENLFLDLNEETNQISNRNSTILNTMSVVPEFLDDLSQIKTYVDTYHEFPEIIINNETISQSTLLYILCNFVLNESSFNIQDFPSVKSYILTDCYNISMNKTQYITFANNIINFYSVYGRPPANVLSDIGHITFDDTVYFYLNIVNYYNDYNELPESQVVQEYLNIYNATVNNFQQLKNLLTMTTTDYNFMIITINDNFSWNEVIIVSSSIKRIYIQCNLTSPIQSNQNLLNISAYYDIVINNLQIIQNWTSNGSIVNYGYLSIINSSLNGEGDFYSWMIYNYGHLFFYNTEIICNESVTGGILVNMGNVSIYSSQFINNYCIYGIFFNYHAILNIFNSSFNDNKVVNSFIHNNESNLTITDCTISDNSVILTAHFANFLDNSAGNVTLSENIFYSNRFYGDNFINNNGTLILRENIISNQTISSTSLIYSVGGNVLLYGNDFYNISNSQVPLLLYNNRTSNANLFYNYVSNNFAHNSKLIYNQGSINLSHNYFENNSANSTIYVEDGNVSFALNNFFNNHAETGGVIYIGGGMVNVTSNNFHNNSVNNSGGVIVNDRGNLLSKSNTYFNNSAGKGAAIYTTNATTVLINDIVKYNNAYLGSAILSENNSILLIQNTTISNNTAINKGAAIYSNNSIISINDSNIYNNIGEYGAGLCIYNNSVLRLTNVLLTNNNATYSGGALYSNNSAVLIYNSRLIKNNALNGVGGCLSCVETSLTINNSNFTGNTANYGGAIAQLSQKFTTIDDSLFANNNAIYDGGALYFVYGLININSTKFSNNIATNKAGAIYTRYVSVISCDSSLFDINNHASNGSVVYAYKSSLMFENNIILSGEQNLIYMNNSTYDLNANWWGLNNPNFHIITNNITPDNWRVLYVSVYKNNSIKQLNISINILSDGSITTENILSRAVVTLYNSSSDVHYIEDNISITYNASVGNITVLMDNQQINIDNQIDSYIIIKDVYAKVNENISFIIHTNAKNGKFVIKVNGKTIKDETGRVIYAKNINGTCIFNYTIPNNFSNEIYNISTVYSGSTTYKSARINSYLYINQSPNYLSLEDTVSSNKIEPSLKMESSIVTPGTSNIIEAWMNDDINGDVQISIYGQTSNVSVSSGHISYNFIATDENYKLINVTIHFNGNQKYLSKTWTLHLYSQYDEQVFDMRNYGLVTPIKNQYSSSACWAFASIGTLESAILKKYNISMDFSENHLKNSANKYSLNFINNGINQGNSLLGAINLLISGKSLVYEEEDTFDSESIISHELQNKFQVTDVIFMNYTQDISQISTIKSMILDYGAVFTNCHSGNDSTNLYSYNNKLPDHAIMLVGWDDNYSKYHFNDKGVIPEDDGAFIVKNSWGDNKGVNGYYYISYYDKSIGTNTTGFNIFAFDLSNEDNYTKIYQSESMSTFTLSKNESNTLWIKNNYHAESAETIKAVGTYFFNKTSYQIYIYKNGHLMSTQEETVDYVGYHTIKLNTLVYLQQNDNFTIKIKLNTTNTCNIFIQDCNQTIFDSEPKKSYISINGLDWIDLYQINAIASLKVYTTSENNEFQVTTTVSSNKVKLRLNNIPVTKYNLTYTVNNRLIGIYNITSQRTFYADLEDNETENINVKIQYNTKNYNYTKINLLYPKNEEKIRNITIPNFIYDNQEFDNTQLNRINYTTIIPCYVNVTLPNVIEVENDPYNIYIQKPGENGTVIIPMQRLINITIANTTYTFSNVQDTNMQYILKQASYFIPLNGSPIIQCTQTYTPDNNGILIIYNNYNIILKYYYNLKNPINQFASISNTTIQENYNQRVPRNNQTMYVELVRYNLNGITTATIRYTEGMLYDQHGIKHQLYIQGIIQNPDDTYNYQENGICYTNTNELLLYNASNDKIIREDYSQNITSIFTCDNSSVTRNEMFTFGNYGITNTLQSYTIVKSLINKTLFTEWINKEYPNATTIMKNMFLIGLKTFYLNDEYCNIISKITNTTYNRTFNTIIMTGLNNDTAYIHSPDSLMGITVEGGNEDNNTITFRLFTTIALPSIETNVLNSMAKVSSPIIHLLEAIENEDYFLIEEENNLIIISNDLQSILKLNTETGIVVDYLNINANTYHGLITNDSSKTSLFHFDVDSPEAQAQNLAGQVLMNVGSYVFDVPVAGTIAGSLIFAAGAVICADANGCFSMDETNMSRVSKTCVDIGTNIPFLKVGSLISSKLAGVGIVDKISEGVGHLAEHSQYFYDAFESGTNAVITFVGEFLTKTENQTIESIVIDSVFNAIPLRTYSKTFSEYPYRLGSMIKKVSKDSDNYVKNMFKMLDRYDKELKIFGEEVGDLLRASVFVTFNTFETTVNVLCNNYIYDVFKMIFDTKNSTFLSELMGFGFNITSRDSSYVAITQVKR